MNLEYLSVLKTHKIFGVGSEAEGGQAAPISKNIWLRSTFLPLIKANIFTSTFYLYKTRITVSIIYIYIIKCSLLLNVVEIVEKQ